MTFVSNGKYVLLYYKLLCISLLSESHLSIMEVFLMKSYEGVENLIQDIRRSVEFREQLGSISKRNKELARLRVSPVTVSTIRSEDILEILSLLVRAWPPVDVRAIEGATKDRVEFQQVNEDADTFLRDLIYGMRVVESSRSLKDRSVTFDILLQANLNDFTKYNKLVTQHNKKWIAKGAPRYDFDPFTGEETRLRDTYVDKALPDSDHFQMAGFGLSSGELQESRPKVRRVKYGTIECRIDTTDTKFVVSYVARDIKGYILCYDTIHGEDLSKIVRRIAQELFGNAYLEHYTGSQYSGISQLFKGLKLKICKDRHLELPSWAGKRFKYPTRYEQKARLWGILTILVRFIGAPALMLFYLYKLYAYMTYAGLHDVPLVSQNFFPSIAVFIISLVVMLKVADALEEHFQELVLIDLIQ